MYIYSNLPKFIFEVNKVTEEKKQEEQIKY